MFKLFKENPFKTIFVNENNFVGSDDKFSLVKIFNDGSYIWVLNTMCKYNEISKKTNKPYSSITLKLDWEYTIFQNKKEVGTLTGKQIIERFFEEKKQSK